MNLFLRKYAPLTGFQLLRSHRRLLQEMTGIVTVAIFHHVCHSSKLWKWRRPRCLSSIYPRRNSYTNDKNISKDIVKGTDEEISFIDKPCMLTRKLDTRRLCITKPNVVYVVSSRAPCRTPELEICSLERILVSTYICNLWFGYLRVWSSVPSLVSCKGIFYGLRAFICVFIHYQSFANHFTSRITFSY